MKKWYAVYTKPNSEYLVEEQLQADKIETYLPVIESTAADKPTRPVPLFPCYLFARIDLEREKLSRWRWRPGVHHIVAADDIPISIPDRVIEMIRKKVWEATAAGTFHQPAFEPGEIVRVKSGPFSNFLAIFERETSSGTRVEVLINFLGQLSRTQLDRGTLEKPPKAAKIKIPRRTRGRGRPILRPGPEGLLVFLWVLSGSLAVFRYFL